MNRLPRVRRGRPGVSPRSLGKPIGDGREGGAELGNQFGAAGRRQPGMKMPHESHERADQGSVKSPRRKRSHARCLDRPVKRSVVAAESLVMRSVSRLMDIKNGDHEAGATRISAHATGCLNVFGTCFRLAEHHHQAKSRDIEADRDHVGRQGRVDSFRIGKRFSESALRVGDLPRAYPRCQFENIPLDKPLCKKVVGGFPATPVAVLL